MKNIDKVRAMSVEELANKLDKKGECGFCVRKCDGWCSNCEDNIIRWLNQEVTPELKAGDILLSTTPSEYYIAVASDKLLTARSLTVLDLDKVLRHDQIACIKRWNGTNVETIWRADNGEK